MKGFLFLILSLTISVPVNAWEQHSPYPLAQCLSQAPYGYPHTAKQGTAICRLGYVSLNDPIAKLPIWVSYLAIPDKSIGCVLRSNAFAPDQSLPKGSRAELADYAKSGYDIGHVAPNSDQNWSTQVELESFLLTNMMPQLPGLNRATWKLLETSIRSWVLQRNHPMVIYAGPIYNTADPVIGISKVIIPHAFYKIVIDTISNEVLGFIFPHTGGLGNDLRTVRAPILQIEQLTGVDFIYPTNAVELPLNQIWAVNFGALINAKRSKCGTSIITN